MTVLTENILKALRDLQEKNLLAGQISRYRKNFL